MATVATQPKTLFVIARDPDFKPLKVKQGDIALRHLPDAYAWGNPPADSSARLKQEIARARCPLWLEIFHGLLSLGLAAEPQPDGSIELSVQIPSEYQLVAEHALGTICSRSYPTPRARQGADVAATASLQADDMLPPGSSVHVHWGEDDTEGMRYPLARGLAVHSEPVYPTWFDLTGQNRNPERPPVGPAPHGAGAQEQ